MSIENPNFDPENVQSVIEEENQKSENQKICTKSDDSKIQNSSENETKMSETDILLEKRKLQNMLVLGFSFLFIFAGFLTAGATRKFSEIFLKYNYFERFFSDFFKSETIMRSFSQRTGLKVNGFIIQGNAHYNINYLFEKFDNMFDDSS